MKQLWDLYKKHREGIDYLFWGGIAFLLSMFLFWLFAGKWGWPEVFANTINWIICVIFTFFTNKLFVCKPHYIHIYKNSQEVFIDNRGAEIYD